MAATAQELAVLLAQRASEIEESCVGLDGDAAARRPAPDAWCIREHLSHLNGDDRYGFVDGIRSILFEEVRELDVEPGITHYNTDRRHIALPVLVSAVAAQYRAIADLASRMTDEELGTRVGIDLLKDTSFGPVPALAEWLTAIGEMHVPGHIAEIRDARVALGA